MNNKEKIPPTMAISNAWLSAKLKIDATKETTC